MADLKITQIYSLKSGAADQELGPELDWMPVTRQNSEQSDARTTLRMPYPRGDGDAEIECSVCHGTGVVSKLVEVDDHMERTDVECDACAGTGIEPSGAVHVDGNGVVTVHTDGRSITVDSGKLTAHGTYEAGDGIDIDGEVISAKIDNATIKLDENGNMAVGISAGDGISIDNGEISVVAGGGLKVDNKNRLVLDADGKTLVIGPDGSVSAKIDLVAGDGIRVIDNQISLRTDSAGGLSVNDDGTLKVSVDDATVKINSNNELYVNSTVNAGDGLEAEGQVVKAKAGAGVTVDSDGINVNVDGETIELDQTGNLHVTKEPVAGDAIDVKSNVVSVKPGAGLKIDGKTDTDTGTVAVDVDDVTLSVSGTGKLRSNVKGGDGLSVKMDDNTVSVKLAETGGIGLDESKSLEVKVDDSTIKIDPDTGALYANAPSGSAGDGLAVEDGKYHVVAGQAISVDADGVHVAVDDDTVKIVDGKLHASPSSRLTAGDGISIEDDTVSVKAGFGLDIGLSGVIAKTDNTTVGVIDDKITGLYTGGDGISVEGANISIDTGDGLTISDSGSVMANVDNKTIAIKNGKLSAKRQVEAGTGLTLGNDNIVKFNVGNGLHVDQQNNVNVGADGVTIVANGGVLRGNYEGENGITVDENKIGIDVGTALDVSDGKLNVSIDDVTLKVVDGKLTAFIAVESGDGILVDGNVLSINTGSGLRINGTSGAVELAIDPNTMKLEGGVLTCTVTYCNGAGLSLNDNEFSINVGDGLIVNNDNAVVANVDSTTIVVKNGKLVAVQQLKQGDGIEINPNTNVISIHLAPNSALRSTKDGLSVSVDNVTVGVSGNTLTGKYTGGDGIGINGAEISFKNGSGLTVSEYGVVSVKTDTPDDTSIDGFWPSKTVMDKINNTMSKAHYTAASLLAEMPRTQITGTGERFRWNLIAADNVTLEPDASFKVGSDDVVITKFKADVTFTIECPEYLTNASEYAIRVNESTYMLDTTKLYNTFTYSALVTKDRTYPPYFNVFLYEIERSEEETTLPVMYLSAKIEGIGV